MRSKATYTYTGTFRRRARSPRDRQRPAAAERCESGGEDASFGAISLAIVTTLRTDDILFLFRFLNSMSTRVFEVAKSAPPTRGCNFCLGPMVDSLRSDLGHTIDKRARLAIKPSQMHQGALFEVRGSAQPRASAPAANSLSCPSGELQTVPISRFVRRASLSMYHCPSRTAAVLNKLSSS